VYGCRSALVEVDTPSGYHSDRDNSDEVSRLHRRAVALVRLAVARHSTTTTTNTMILLQHVLLLLLLLLLLLVLARHSSTSVLVTSASLGLSTVHLARSFGCNNQHHYNNIMRQGSGSKFLNRRRRRRASRTESMSS